MLKKLYRKLLRKIPVADPSELREMSPETAALPIEDRMKQAALVYTSVDPDPNTDRNFAQHITVLDKDNVVLAAGVAKDILNPLFRANPGIIPLHMVWTDYASRFLPVQA